MKLSIDLQAFLVRSLSVGKAMMLKRLSIFALALAGCGVSVTQADATFSYELSAADDKKAVKQFSIARFFVRIDDPGEAKQYLLFQAGRFFPMYAVNATESTYRLLTPAANPRLGPVSRSDYQDMDDADKDSQQQASEAPSGSEDTAEVKPPPEPAARPEAAVAESEATSDEPTGRWPVAILKASKKTRNVAGIRCRVVQELIDGEPVMEHCMANGAALGVTTREVITLSRLFRMARKMSFDWLGVGSKDEEFIAVQSRDLRDNRLLQLTSVSTKPLPAGYLRIPRTFKQIESDAQSESGS